MLAFTNTPPAGTVGHYIYEVSALLFQLGLVALVTLQLRTARHRHRQAGPRLPARRARPARPGDHLDAHLALLPRVPGHGWFLALDVFWPLSMLGMAAIGIRIAIAGRWKGAARFWPLVAESWAPVCVPFAALTPAIAHFVGAGHLAIGYVMLGVILARRPELTGARD